MTSKVFIAKCSQCKVRSELEVCEVCDEAKCKECVAQHLMEAQEKWDTIEITLLEIDHRQKKYISQNNHSLDSLNVSLGQLQKTYEAVLVKLKQFYDENTKQINDLIKVYRKKNENMTERWKLLATNEIYKKWIENGYRYLVAEDPTELEILIERIQYYFREEFSDDDYPGKRFEFDSHDQTVRLGTLDVLTRVNVEFDIAPRRLKCFIRRQYSDIEERIARVTDSNRTNDDLLNALNGPLSTRETRMEVVAWIAVCQFNCRIFGGFVRDWIVGGYSVKPTQDSNSCPWITYTRYVHSHYGEQQIPHINKEFVPNDIDCCLPDDNFDIAQFLDYLRKYEIKCGAVCETQRGYVLLLDEHRSPFSMDLISGDSAVKLHKYRILDLDVNNLYVEKDYRCELGIRRDLVRNELAKFDDLEIIVKNIRDKRFKVLRSYDIEDRIEKMTRRGWTQLVTDGNDEVEESGRDHNDNHRH